MNLTLKLTTNESFRKALELRTTARQQARLPLKLVRDIEDMEVIGGALLVYASKRTSDQVQRIRKFDPGIERAEWSLNKMEFDGYFHRRAMTLPLAWSLFWNSITFIAATCRKQGQNATLHFTFHYPIDENLHDVRQHSSMSFHRDTGTPVIDSEMLDQFKLEHIAYVILDNS